MNKEEYQMVQSELKFDILIYTACYVNYSLFA